MSSVRLPVHSTFLVKLGGGGGVRTGFEGEQVKTGVRMRRERNRGGLPSFGFWR